MESRCVVVAVVVESRCVVAAVVVEGRCVVEVVVVESRCVVVAALSPLDGVRDGWQRLAYSVPVPSIVQDGCCVWVMSGSLPYVLRQHVGDLVVGSSRRASNVVGRVVTVLQPFSTGFRNNKRWLWMWVWSWWWLRLWLWLGRVVL